MAVRGHLVSPKDCIGCVACAKVCPTKAIRVRGRFARVNAELCIDCGACVRICPQDAARAATSPPSDLRKFKYTIALPSLTLYGQFGRDVEPAQVLRGLTRIGFDAAFDISWMCEMVSSAIDAYLTECSGPWPKVSVTCPAVVRLIQIRYPGMIPHFVPMEAARELAAKLLRRKVAHEMSLQPHEVGVFFITPCTAIINSILNPVGIEQSRFDGALSIAEIYPALLRAIKEQGPVDSDERVSPRGLLWAMAGGEIAAMRNANTMTVRGVEDVTYVFDRLESGKFQSVDYIEAYICPDGCVSGVLTMEGRYAAQRTIQQIAKRLEAEDQAAIAEEKVRSLLREHFFDLEEEIRARPIQPLAVDLRQAIARRRQQDTILARLPGVDCGACGAPDCATLAEDVVRGRAELDECVFVKIDQLQEQVRSLKEGADE